MLCSSAFFSTSLYYQIQIYQDIITTEILLYSSFFHLVIMKKKPAKPEKI